MAMAEIGFCCGFECEGAKNIRAVGSGKWQPGVNRQEAQIVAVCESAASSGNG
jgi:hypothetical protein